MRAPTLLTTLILPLLTLASETSIHNKCPFPLYYAPVDSTPPSLKTITTIESNSYILQDLWFDGATGTALKLTTTPDGLWANKPVLQLGYTSKDGEVYYNLDAVNGYDFWGQNVVLRGDKEGSESVEWWGKPGEKTVRHWVGELGLTLTVCA